MKFLTDIVLIFGVIQLISVPASAQTYAEYYESNIIFYAFKGDP